MHDSVWGEGKQTPDGETCLPATENGRDELEARLEFLGMRLHLHGPAPWVFATVLALVAAVVVLKLTGH